MVKIGYADPAQAPAADPVSIIAQATAAVTQSITGFLGLRQQRLAQESTNELQKKALDTQVELSEEEYWKQISAQNALFGKDLLSIERQKRNIWQTPTGLLIIISVPILIGLLVYFIVKKG